MTLSGVNPDKVVVITGSSSGLGAGMAEFFAEIGYKKIVLVRTYCTKKSYYFNHSFPLLTVCLGGYNQFLFVCWFPPEL